jgi:hypothetical protein
MSAIAQPVIRINASAKNGTPAAMLKRPVLDDAWFADHVTLTGFGSIEDAARVFLEDAIVSRIVQMHDISHSSKPAEVTAAFKNTSVELASRDIPALSLAQFREDNPVFKDLDDKKLRAMIAALQPDVLVVD